MAVSDAAGLDARISAVSEPVADEADRRRCLVVDDEPALLDLVQDILEGAGYIVETVTSGIEALALLKERRFDLIISDIRMPEIDGFQFLELLHEGSAEKTHRVLLVTGDLLDEQVQSRIGEIGAEVLYKPFDIEALLAAVRRVIA